MHDAVVVATPDGILVTDKAASSQLKQYVPHYRPMYEKRQWGEYKVLDFRISDHGESYLTKELTVFPGKNLSYQRHQHRSEIWTFVSGEGLLVLNGIIKKVSRGDMAYIYPDMLHGLKAATELHLIEVQVGSELTEEDIERFDYAWDKV